MVETMIHKSIKFAKQNAPTILTCVGAAGVVVTSILTAKATPKALLLLDNAKEDKGEDLTKTEKIKIAGPSYIPALVTGAATISCIFGANVLNKKQQAALVSAYAFLDQSFKEYRAKVEDLYGEGSDKKVKEEIAKDNYDNSNVEKTEGKELFYDEYSKRYFESTHEKVLRAEYELNRNLTIRDYVYLNEWYEGLGLEPIDHGNKMGWSTPMTYDMYWQPWIDFSHSKIILDDGRECNVIYMLEEPIMDFEDYFG